MTIEPQLSKESATPCRNNVAVNCCYAVTRLAVPPELGGAPTATAYLHAGDDITVGTSAVSAASKVQMVAWSLEHAAPAPHTSLAGGAGKSNLLEAINLALTGRLRGGPVAAELSPFLVNLQATHAYVAALRERRPAEPPEILVELYFDDTDDLAALRGANNSLRESAPGAKIRIAFNTDYIDEYVTYTDDPARIAWVPTEYYQVYWTNFAGEAITARGVPATATLIDATAIRLPNGADAYLQSIIADSLDTRQRVELSRA